MMDVAEHIRPRSMLSEADAIYRDLNILENIGSVTGD
jgi:hypothetical protein